MYNRRFKNKQGRRIFELKGRFSLMHLGGGTFVYSFPGRYYPIVGRVELWRKKYRHRGLSFLIASAFVTLGIGIVSNAGTADPIASAEELERLESEGKIKPEELEARSEKIKSQLYGVENDHQIKRTGKVKIIEYTVKNGDTLSSIALRKHVPASVIAASSGIKIGTVLKTGMKIQIPDRPGLYYKFKKGDTLAAVAQHYSVDIDKVIRDNPEVSDLDMLEPGNRLFLPNAKIPAPPIRWMRPLVGGRFTSRFGWRRHPMLSKRHFHTGIDIGVYRKRVRAVRNGQVLYAGWLGSYGKAIVIRHESGFKSLYAHLSSVKVRRGQYVKMGQGIGITGNTGRSTGPHLHFEIIKNGRPVNPRRYVRF